MGNAVAVRTAGHPRLSGHALQVLRDEKLASLVAGGNDDAFAILYRRHHQSVYRYCLSLLRQEADARDALQSSMLAALSALRASPIEGAFKPWLFRIAHNQSISIIRARAREAPTAAASEVASSDGQQTREELRTLISDLGALPERQRGAIVMRELNGLSYAEIAAVLATSEAGGKQLVYEARTALHELRDGHEMSCDLVRERISAGDRRLLRGRKVRSHLRGCQACQDFEQAIRRRRAAFAALAPPLAPLVAVAVLQDVFGSGAGGGGAGGAGSAAAGATGATSGSAPLAVFKVMTAALLTGVAGVGAYEAASGIFADPGVSTSAAVAQEPPHSVHQGNGDPRAGKTAHAGRARSGHGGAGARTGGSAKAQSGSHGAKPLAESESTQTGGASSPTPGGGDPGDAAGSGDSSGGSSGGTVDPPPPTEPPPPPGGGGDAPPGTPAGHGGVPPGQGGIPPGQSGSDVPPGQLGNPGGGGHP
jgi:RNA polymerase sigma factor (sigma-70 family)